MTLHDDPRKAWSVSFTQIDVPNPAFGVNNSVISGITFGDTEEEIREMLKKFMVELSLKITELHPIEYDEGRKFVVIGNPVVYKSGTALGRKAEEIKAKKAAAAEK